MTAGNGRFASPDEGRGDVALFIDWENIKSSLSDRGLAPNVSSLREAAESYGRVVVAKAYADWQDAWLRGDPPHLYAAGIEPVYVPTRVFGAGGTILPERRKNSVDVKLASDCIECCHNYPHINTYILVSGDGDFIHVVNILRPYGKRVVVIGASWSFSAFLRDSVDEVLYYDRDVEPLTPSGAPAVTGSANRDQDLDRLFALVVEIVRDSHLRGRALLTWVRDELARRLGGFDPRQYGFAKFKPLMLEAERRGYIRVVTYGLVDWAYLPHIPLLQPDATDNGAEADGEPTAPGGGNAEAERISQLIRFAHQLEQNNDHVSFNFLLDEVLRAGFWNLPRGQLSDRLNDIIDAGVFLRVAHPWQDRETGEPITIRTLKLNRQHPLVIAALGESSAVERKMPAPVAEDEALARALEELERSPDDPEAHLQVARRYLQLKRYDDALKHQRRAVELAPDEPLYHTYVARTLAQAGRVEAAEAYCEEAIARFPDDHRPRATLGMILYQQQRYAEALPYLLAAMERCPKDSPEYLVQMMALARTYRDLGDEQAMRRIIEEGLSIDPNHKGLLELKQWLELTPKQREALAMAKQAASMIGREGEEEELIHYASSAIVLDPEISYLPYYALGEAYKSLQRWEMAIDALEKAAARCDNPGTLRIIYSNLRNLYSRINRHDKAEAAQAEVERLTAEIQQNRRNAKAPAEQ